jgi:hypothetical protein
LQAHHFLSVNIAILNQPAQPAGAPSSSTKLLEALAHLILANIMAND